LDQAETDAALDEALVVDDEEIRTSDFPIRFDSSDDFAAALSCRVSEESRRSLPRKCRGTTISHRRARVVQQALRNHTTTWPMNRRETAPPHHHGSMIQCVSSAWEGHVGAEKAAAPALVTAAFTPAWARVEMADGVAMKWGRRRQWKSIWASVKPSMRGGRWVWGLSSDFIAIEVTW
jgi:hypothetical protein